MKILGVPIKKVGNTYTMTFLGNDYGWDSDIDIPQKQILGVAKHTIQRALVKDLYKNKEDGGKYTVVAIEKYKEIVEKNRSSDSESNFLNIVPTPFMSKACGWEEEQVFYTDNDKALLLKE